MNQVRHGLCTVKNSENPINQELQTIYSTVKFMALTLLTLENNKIATMLNCNKGCC